MRSKATARQALTLRLDASAAGASWYLDRADLCSLSTGGFSVKISTGHIRCPARAEVRAGVSKFANQSLSVEDRTAILWILWRPR
jgi:hypothetical protein